MWIRLRTFIGNWSLNTNSKKSYVCQIQRLKNFHIFLFIFFTKEGERQKLKKVTESRASRKRLLFQRPVSVTGRGGFPCPLASFFFPPSTLSGRACGVTHNAREQRWGCVMRGGGEWAGWGGRWWWEQRNSARWGFYQGAVDTWRRGSHA